MITKEYLWKFYSQKMIDANKFGLKEHLGFAWNTFIRSPLLSVERLLHGIVNFQALRYTYLVSAVCLLLTVWIKLLQRYILVDVLLTLPKCLDMGSASYSFDVTYDKNFQGKTVKQKQGEKSQEMSPRSERPCVPHPFDSNGAFVTLFEKYLLEWLIILGTADKIGNT